MSKNNKIVYGFRSELLKDGEWQTVNTVATDINPRYEVGVRGEVEHQCAVKACIVGEGTPWRVLRIEAGKDGDIGARGEAKYTFPLVPDKVADALNRGGFEYPAVFTIPEKMGDVCVGFSQLSERGGYPFHDIVVADYIVPGHSKNSWAVLCYESVGGGEMGLVWRKLGRRKDEGGPMDRSVVILKHDKETLREDFQSRYELLGRLAEELYHARPLCWGADNAYKHLLQARGELRNAVDWAEGKQHN